MKTAVLIEEGVSVACKQPFPRKFVQKVGEESKKGE